MKIIVAGYGPVGKATASALRNHPDVEVFIDDPFLGHNYNPDGLTPPDGVIICVATPMDPLTGKCVTDNVRDVMEKYEGSKIMIKSTTDPVWLRENCGPDVTFCPEFLKGTTGADPTEEFLESEFAIYGGGHMRFWHELFKPVLWRLKTVKFVSLEQAAFAKYVLNCFLATKVTFFNQIHHLYNTAGFHDFDIMIDAVCTDPRVGESHTQVPGPDGEFGYGGHCFPKDMSALNEMGKACYANTDLLQYIIDLNTDIRDDGYPYE